MDRLELAIKAAAAAAAAIWGGLIPLVQLLLTLMVIDIATGVLVAIQKRELSSDVSWRGMTKKALVLLVVAAAAAVETYAAPAVGNIPLQATVAGFYAATELLSVIENAVAAGLPVPGVLRDVLKKLAPATADPGGSDGNH